VGKDKRKSSTPLIIAGALALWGLGWILLPSLDPGPRPDWRRRPATQNSIGPDADGGISFTRRDRSFPRPWCPLCRAVEENVTDNQWVSQLTGITQLILLATVVAGGLSLVDGAGGGGRSGERRTSDRRRQIDEERIMRAVGRDLDD
jgi:hypothetical protein